MANFLAHSCAAARDFHPLPCLRQVAKTRIPKEIRKNRKTCEGNLLGDAGGSQITLQAGDGAISDLLIGCLCHKDASTRNPCPLAARDRCPETISTSSSSAPAQRVLQLPRNLQRPGSP